MDHEAPHPPKPTSPWTVMAIGAALLLVAGAGGIFAIQDQLKLELKQTSASHTEASEKLSRRLDTLQSTLDSLSSKPEVDAEAITRIEATLSELQNTLEAMKTRQDALEQKFEEAKATPVVTPAATALLGAKPEALAAYHALQLAATSGKPFAEELSAWLALNPTKAEDISALSAVASEGIATEASLTQHLRETLETMQKTTPTVDDTSMMGKINTHMSGLIRIKKSGKDDPYDALRKDALSRPLEESITQIERMDDAARAPLESWLEAAIARRKALAALHAITPPEGP